MGKLSLFFLKPLRTLPKLFVTLPGRLTRSSATLSLIVLTSVFLLQYPCHPKSQFSTDSQTMVGNVFTQPTSLNHIPQTLAQLAPTEPNLKILETSSQESPKWTSSRTLVEQLPPVSGKFLIITKNAWDDLPLEEYTGLSFVSYEEALQFKGGNVGNNVWKYAGWTKLLDFSRTLTCNETIAVCMAQARRSNPPMQPAEYRPLANYFNTVRAQNSNGYSFQLKVLNEGVFTFLVGVGVSLSFSKNESANDLIPGLKIETGPEDLDISEQQKLVLHKMQEGGFPMLCRGDLTASIAKLHGYQYAISNGCPSLMISETLRLGEVLEAKYKALQLHIGNTSLKVAISYKGTPRYTAFVKDVLGRYPNSYVYAQGVHDFGQLRSAGVEFSRIRFFPDVREWRDSISTMDVAIGARIHGNMIALAAGVPVLVIAPDHRVLELVQRMMVPHVTYYADEVRVGADVAAVVGAVGIDGKRFDRNRCEIAQTYVKIFTRYGMKVSTHVQGISEIC